MNTRRIEMMGAYVQAMLDSAQVRGELTPETAQTLLNGVVDLWAGDSKPSFEIPRVASGPGALLDAVQGVAERERTFRPTINQPVGTPHQA